jgi:hypothetical protein
MRKGMFPERHVPHRTAEEAWALAFAQPNNRQFVRDEITINSRLPQEYLVCRELAPFLFRRGR